MPVQRLQLRPVVDTMQQQLGKRVLRLWKWVQQVVGSLEQQLNRLVRRLRMPRRVAGSLRQRPSKLALRLPWRAVDKMQPSKMQVQRLLLRPVADMMQQRLGKRVLPPLMLPQRAVGSLVQQLNRLELPLRPQLLAFDSLQPKLNMTGRQHMKRAVDSLQQRLDRREQQPWQMLQQVVGSLQQMQSKRARQQLRRVVDN
jgi:exonuclease VII large subunit